MKPLVGISCCTKIVGPHRLANHAASDYCVRAINQHAEALPVLLPALGNALDLNCLLDRIDGILLTGSQSNVAACLYGEERQGEFCLEDPARDETTLPLIRAAIGRGIPVLAICRGLQEMNVALGGTLHQCIRLLPGRINHYLGCEEGTEIRAEKAHSVALTSGGLLHRLAGAREIEVNSFHHQGIDRLAPGLAVEATAPDGTIEAIRVVNSRAFALGVQWHPEFDACSDVVSADIFAAFGDAVRRRGQPQMMAAD